MKLEEAKNKFKGEWIAFQVSREEPYFEGKVLLHKKNRREFDSELLRRGIKDVYITYAGPPFPAKYAAFFIQLTYES